jgi:hypothetical protein
MPALSFRQAGLVLRRNGASASHEQIRDLQQALRSLGYLKSGIDGVFGDGVEAAIKALQWDLLSNDGASTANDGQAPVRAIDYNRGRVSTVTGAADQGLVECIAEILDDPKFPKLPFAPDAAAANARFVADLAGASFEGAPVPFLVAILKQESALRHYHEPGAGDRDTFITVGLDTNDSAHPERITSRGYGAGQHTLFHHPPQPKEIEDYMLDAAGNVRQAALRLREKFDHFLLGATSGTCSEDRIAEAGRAPLRLCKFGCDDARHLKDCRQCAHAAGTSAIQCGVTPLYPGAGDLYQPTAYYASTSYAGVPIRKNLGCDWPYAARRYNGAGMNSYHYQAKILKNLL